METGLSGHPLIPQLPSSGPGPLFYLLDRLGEVGGAASVRRLKCVLDSLEFIERYFAGVAGGLLRKLEDPPNLRPLVQNADRGHGLRRLLRFCLNRLKLHSEAPGVEDLFACFYLHGKQSLPYSHSRWMGLVSGDDLASSDLDWNYATALEKLSAPAARSVLATSIQNLSEVLQSLVEGGTAFFEAYEHFARLDEEGWQCTLRKGDLFIELTPPVPTRLIPLEAQVPTSTPQTEDELLLTDIPFAPPYPSAPSTESAQEEVIALGGLSETLEETPPEEVLVTPPVQVQIVTDHEVDLLRWSTAELKSFKDSLQQIYPPLDLDRVPREYLNKLSRFISSVSSGYILLEGKQGSGKTLLTEAFRNSLMESGLQVTPLLFSVKNQFYPDTDTFLEQLNESLRIEFGATHKTFEALHPEVIKDLNTRNPGDSRSRRFSSFLSELKLVNGTPLVLLLDGIDEGPEQGRLHDSLFSYLPRELPTDIYIVVSYHPDRVRQQEKDILEAIHAGPSLRLTLSAEDALYRDFLERFLSWSGYGPLTENLVETLLERSGNRLATAQHFLDGLRCELLEDKNDLPPAELVYEGILNRLYEQVPDRYLDLFLLLATSDEPVNGEELSALGISRTDVLELVHSLPSLFHCHQERRLGLSLAHRSLRLHIQRTFLTSYANSCLRLGKRALERTRQTEFSVLPIKRELEWLGESLRRLVRWATDSQEPNFLAEVCADPTVNRLRRRVFAAMEERVLYHRKVLVLDTFIQALRQLVEVEKRESFREELAWSFSSRALSYYHLGHYPRASKDIEKALKHFRVLIDEEGRENLRNGLAATYNRRSEVYRGLKEWSRALTDADRAVLNYESVVGSGRSDLTSLWMLARHNRAEIYRALKSYHQAETDLRIAFDGYTKLVERENRRDLRPQLADVHKSRALLALDQGNLESALSSANAGLELLETLVQQENYEHLRNELASIYNDRGAILSQMGVLDEAERDYASAIAIRTYLVAEGRIDLRTDLANTYANRGLCQIPRCEYEEAQESFDRAVEILDRLVEEEKREDLYADRAFALNCRGSLFRLKREYDLAREDLTAAVGDYRLAVVSLGTEHLEALAGTLNSLAEVSLLSGDHDLARKSCERVLEIFEEKLSPERREALTRERAAAHHNLGVLLQEENDLLGAEEELKRSIELLTRLVETDGQPELVGELASSLLCYAKLPTQNANERLKLASRALALFKSSQSPDMLPKLVETYLLRASAFKNLGSFGSALDDVSAAIDRLKTTYRNEPSSGLAMISALLERASLYRELKDPQTSLQDLERARETISSLKHLSSSAMELRQCHVLLEHVRLLSIGGEEDFEASLKLLQELDARLENLPLNRLASAEYNDLRRRSIRTFKGLRLLALMPTREESDYELAVNRLSLLLETAHALQPNFRSLLESDWHRDQDVDPITRLHTQRGWSLVKLGRLEEALADFETTLAALPKVSAETGPDILEYVAEVESGRGAILDSLGRLEEAVSAYSRGVEAFGHRPESALSPQRASCLNSRALLLQKLGRYEAALDDLDPAIEIARSNLQRRELLQRSIEKVRLLRQLGRPEESLETLRDSLISIPIGSALEPHEELQLRLGVYELTGDTDERNEALVRTLRLLTSELRLNPERWRDTASRLVDQLPLPDQSVTGREIEALIVSFLEALLRDHPTGYTPLTETILRRAARLSEIDPDDTDLATLSASLYCLATSFCYLEYQKYGNKSLPRLVRCYLLTAQQLVSADPPRQLSALAKGIEAITRAVTLSPPTGELEVEVNNMARLWLALPPSRLVSAGLSKMTLQKLRRW